jgi:hypothetical protein
MKNLYSKNEFLTLQKEGDMINEGFIGKMFKGLWNNVMKLSNKVKGSKEINTVYDKYKKIIDETFAKIGNVGAAETANKVAPSKPITASKTDTPPESPIPEKLNFNLNEADAATTPPVETDDQKTKNTEEQTNLVNLTPEKIAKVAKLTEDRITQLKTQFEGEVNAIIKRLSKTPEYSSDKLTAYSNVMKNQFNTYVFDQWWGIYQKAGDQKKLTELTTAKKENELKFKQAVDELNTKLGEQQQQVIIKKGKKYKYDSKTQGKEIEVEVIGKALGQDENNTVSTDPDHKGMWRVKSVNGAFWVAPSALKGEVKNPTAAVKKENIKVGDKYSFIKKDDVSIGIGTIMDNPKTPGSPIFSEDGSGVTISTDKNPKGFNINIVKLKPTK